MKNTFLESLLLKRKDIESARLTRFAKAVNRAQSALVNELQSKVEMLEEERDNLLDVTDTSGFGISLKKLDSSDTLVRKIQDIDVQLVVAERELQVALKNNKYFNVTTENDDNVHVEEQQG